MSEEVGWGDTMTFRLWMNMYPHDCPHFTGGDLEAAYNALEAAYNAGVGHATTRATAAERERWVAECKRREAHYQTLQKHDGVQPKLLPAMTLRLLRETMEDESDDDPR